MSNQHEGIKLWSPCSNLGQLGRDVSALELPTGLPCITAQLLSAKLFPLPSRCYSQGYYLIKVCALTSQVTQLGTPYCPIFLHSLPHFLFIFPFFLSPPFSYHFPCLHPSDCVVSHSCFFLSFYIIPFSLLRPTFSAPLVHGQSWLLQNGVFTPQSVSLWLMLLVSHPRALY